MRNLNDMNDLYNTQNFVFLCENIESKFELMYNRHFFNSRKCNSASKLSSCIERDLSKIIIVFPTSNSVTVTVNSNWRIKQYKHHIVL